MAFDTIEELLKSKNPQAVVDPNDPNKPKDPNDPNNPVDPNAVVPPPIKPFGDLEVDPLTGHPIFGSGGAGSGLRATLGDSHMRHKAIILKRSFEDGKVKLYEDARGIAERTEINVEEEGKPSGKVVVYKDYDFPGGLAKYKKIDIFSVNEELLGSLNMYPRDKDNPRPVYRFFYDRAEIGSGNGDIALFVAQALVGRNIQSRSGAGTAIDGEIVTTIKHILQTKR
jgi:hypothetical protein